MIQPPLLCRFAQLLIEVGTCACKRERERERETEGVHSATCFSPFAKQLISVENKTFYEWLTFSGVNRSHKHVASISRNDAQPTVSQYVYHLQTWYRTRKGQGRCRQMSVGFSCTHGSFRACQPSKSKSEIKPGPVSTPRISGLGFLCRELQFWPSLFSSTVSASSDCGKKNAPMQGAGSRWTGMWTCRGSCRG